MQSFVRAYNSREFTISGFFLRYLTNSLLIFLFIILCGCNDDLNNSDKHIQPEEEGLKICLPNLDYSSNFTLSRSSEIQNSRGILEPTESEVLINNFYLLAIPIETSSNHNSNQDGSLEENIKIINLSEYSYFSDSNSKYRVYKIKDLNPGKYYFYLFANLKDYIENEIETLTTREEIDEIVLNFATETKGLKLKSGNLPMACLPSEMRLEEGGEMMGESPIELSEENATTIYADMTFLCSKVRYTILFDTSDFSSAFGENYIEFTTEEEIPYITNLSNFTNLLTPSTSVDYLTYDEERYKHHLELNKYEYPATGASYGEERDKVDEDLKESFGETSDKGKTAWQGIVYIPENITERDDDKTFLMFSGSVYDKNGELIDAETYSHKKLTIDGKEKDGNHRGRLYDVAAQVTSPGNTGLKVTTNVTEWTTQTLYYNLNGPFELIVSQSEFSLLESGMWSVLGYYSDTDVTFEFPKYDENIEFLKWELIEENTLNEEGKPYVFTDGLPNHIRFMINPEISFPDLKAISESDKPKYQYFYVKAANLTKKIEIKEFDFKEYLSVTPQDIVIDLLEYLAKGITSGKILISYSTNSNKKVSITCESSGDIFNPDNPLHLTTSEGEAVIEGELNSNSGELRLDYNRLFDGIPYWKQNHTYELTFITEGLEARKVTIKTIPIIADYIIHFKDKDGKWSNPHIYVYNVLELPKDLNNGKAGEPVGYKLTNGNISPALEYDFSRNISFRGWKGYGGPEINDPYADTSIENGYVIFNEGESYEPYINSPRYDFNFDLNLSHTSYKGNWGCSECKGNTNGYGISMENEGDGWWKYTLSGIVSPEKTKIIFSEGHNSDRGSLSFPENGEEISLFNFEDHEGWLLLKGSDGEFTAQNPESKGEEPEEPEGPVYRFYWPFQYGPSIVITDDYNTLIAETSIGKLDTSLGYYYININDKIVEENSYTLLWYEIADLGKKDMNISLSQFQLDEDENHSAYVYNQNNNGGYGIPGKPESFWKGGPSYQGFKLILNDQTPEPEITLKCIYYAGSGYDEVYCSDSLTLPAYSSIKIFNTNNNYYYGASGNAALALSPNVQVKLASSDKNNGIKPLELESKFQGKIYVYLNDYDPYDYRIILIPD